MNATASSWNLGSFSRVASSSADVEGFFLILKICIKNTTLNSFKKKIQIKLKVWNTLPFPSKIFSSSHSLALRSSTGGVVSVSPFVSLGGRPPSKPIEKESDSHLISYSPVPPKRSAFLYY
jgi:hypothetical protein